MIEMDHGPLTGIRPMMLSFAALFFLCAPELHSAEGNAVSESDSEVVGKEQDLDEKKIIAEYKGEQRRKGFSRLLTIYEDYSFLVVASNRRSDVCRARGMLSESRKKELAELLKTFGEYRRVYDAGWEWRAYLEFAASGSAAEVDAKGDEEALFNCLNSIFIELLEKHRKPSVKSAPSDEGANN